jgi:hypothetical protein
VRIGGNAVGEHPGMLLAGPFLDGKARSPVHRSDAAPPDAAPEVWRVHEAKQASVADCELAAPDRVRVPPGGACNYGNRPGLDRVGVIEGDKTEIPDLPARAHQ